MRQRGSLVILIIVLALLVPALVQMARPFFTAFILAALIATVANPIQERLARRLHRPALAAFVTTFGTVLLLGLLLTIASFALSGELSSAYNTLNQRSLEEGGWPALVSGTVDRAIDAVATRVPVNKEAMRTELVQRMKGAGAFLLSSIGTAVGGVATTLMTGLLVTIFLYFLLRYGGDWLARLAALTPLEPHTSRRIIRTLQDSIVANVNGVFAVAMAQGLLLILGFWFVGLRSPVLWGSVGGLASVVPMIGAPLVWAPVTISYLVMGSYWKALLLGAWGTLIVGSVDNILRPIVVGAGERLHPVIIGLAAIGGTYAFGALGILLGPVVVSFVAVLLKELQRLLPLAKGQDSRPPSDVNALGNRRAGGRED
jgi:predicted PurR-regulated permease PerM